MASNFYAAIVLIGGGTGALDAIDGSALADGDAAMVSTDGTIYFYHLDASSGAAESSPDIIKPDTNAGTKRWIKQTLSGAGGANPDYIRLHDHPVSGTDGGAFTAGSWVKRTVTEDVDDGNQCSVAASVITLEAGTYECYITCPANRVQYHQARLRNTDDGATVAWGTSEFNHSTGDVVSTVSIISGQFTIAAQKDFEIQHKCGVTKTVNGLGIASGSGENETYAVAEFWKIS